MYFWQKNLEYDFYHTFRVVWQDAEFLGIGMGWWHTTVIPEEKPDPGPVRNGGRAKECTEPRPVAEAATSAATTDLILGASEQEPVGGELSQSEARFDTGYCSTENLSFLHQH